MVSSDGVCNRRKKKKKRYENLDFHDFTRKADLKEKKGKKMKFHQPVLAFEIIDILYASKIQPLKTTIYTFECCQLL